MREAIEYAAGNHSIYQARRPEFDTGQQVPFRVAPEPFSLSSEQKKELEHIGADVTGYFKAVEEMYAHDVGGVRTILDTGKPQIFLADQPVHYLFVRPDLIITPQGFSICELETSPFGLALAEILNRAYANEGFETIVSQDTLPTVIKSQTPIEGNIVYSKKTQAYSGQMSFLADEVFSGEGRNWSAATAENLPTDNPFNVYRGFYLGEYSADPQIRKLIDSQVNKKAALIPSPTAFMEEKAILSLIFDNRYQEFFRTKLGDTSFKHLRAIIPPTWIVGQEQYFSLGTPNNITSSIDLADLAKSKRTLVLKASGFAHNGSWKEGVHFLHKQAKAKNLQLLHLAQEDKNNLYVIQEFRQGLNVPMYYRKADEVGSLTPMSARVRLTPYFAVGNNEQVGKLLAIKATGCENTDFIHATSTSINTAVN